VLRRFGGVDDGKSPRGGDEEEDEKREEEVIGETVKREAVEA
jgi:hypothetical protein